MEVIKTIIDGIVSILERAVFHVTISGVPYSFTLWQLFLFIMAISILIWGLRKFFIED